MEIFISWSGERGKEIANELRDWLPKAIQATRPWVSDSDIRSGGRWLNDISKKLEAINFGIICLTPESIDSSWILFEAGALSKSVENSYVCPLVFGLEKSDVKGPLSQFQIRSFNKIEFFRLVKSINNFLGEGKFSDKTIEEIYETWWPILEIKIKKIIDSSIDSSPVRADADIIKEILDKVRGIETSLVSKNFSDSYHDMPFDVETLRIINDVDPLTNLGNRSSFTRMIETRIEDNNPFSIFILNIDGFKAVNDQYGHAVGDDVLRVIADRLNNDELKGREVSRLGGDEFGLLFDEVDKVDSLKELARAILDKVQDEIHIEGIKIKITGSIGISIFPKNAQDMNTLMAGADMAIYRAKEEGGDLVKFLDD